MKRIQKVYIQSDRKVDGVGYLFRNGQCVCYKKRPRQKWDGKIIECDLIIPIQSKFRLKNGKWK